MKLKSYYQKTKLSGSAGFELDKNLQTLVKNYQGN